ncbi:MAG: DUF4388 domain-containing protein [Proteobacteria bacterium]|nr:DUF4388 domain-containing protein [Pseudomonadota bacterium]MBU1640805.1 DUF4388 domain-containing protein [Pseudomonadota bacterium]
MNPFTAVFKIVDELNCPLYEKGDLLLLKDNAVAFPECKPACFILIRELTQLLFKLLGKEPPDPSNLHGCGGCTGLIKFKLTKEAFPDKPDTATEKVTKASTSGIHGNLATFSTTEVFQALNLSEKNGIVRFEFPAGPGFAVFRDGEFVRASYQKNKGLPAIFAMLAEQEGSFHFEGGLADEDSSRDQLGNFMMILMEGMRKVDEEGDEGDPSDTDS